MNDENYNDTDWGGPCGAESGCTDGSDGDILSCIPMPDGCCTFLRRLRAPAVRLSYRFDKQAVPDLDKEKASCGSGEKPEDGDPSCGRESTADAGCTCGDTCSCGCKDGTMTVEGSLTVRLFDAAVAGAAVMLLCCMMKCCRRMCRKMF